jgi:hypothetical protein
LATCCLLAVLISLPVLADSQVVSAAGSPSPASVSLQPTDIPGFAPVDPSIFTFQDPNDSSFDQAFIACAGSTPLLSQFDTGPDADVSQAYGQGQNEFGTPQIVIATAVFSDGTSTGAQLAYNTLSSFSFQSCWAQQSDALNTAQGLSVPASPTTVSPLPSPRYGQGTSGFTLNFNYSVLGAPNSFSLEATSIWSGSLVTVLLVLTDQGTFMESSRLALVKALAVRMDASAPPTACEPLNTPEPGNVLITTNQVIQDVSQTVSFQGETDSPNGGTNGTTAPTSTCAWLNPHASPLVSNLKLPKGYLSANVSVTGPYASVQAASQNYQQDKATWEPGATTQSGLGQAAFYLPEQDNVSPLIVLDDQYLLSFGVETKGTEHSGELALAKTVLGILSAQIIATSPPAPPPPCTSHLSASLDHELKIFNDKSQKQLWKLASAGIDIPGGFRGKVSASLGFGELDLCDSSVIIKAAAQTWLSTTPKGPELSLTTTQAAPASGPFIYLGSGARWDLPHGAPPNVHVASQFNWQHASFTISPTFSISFEATKPLQPDVELDVGQYSVPTFALTETLVSHKQSLLRATLGPTLDLTASISKKDAEDLVKDGIAAGEAVQVAIDDVSEDITAEVAQGIEVVESDGFKVIVPVVALVTLVPKLDAVLSQALDLDPDAVTLGTATADVLSGAEPTAGEIAAVDAAEGAATTEVTAGSVVLELAELLPEAA